MTKVLDLSINLYAFEIDGDEKKAHLGGVKISTHDTFSHWVVINVDGKQAAVSIDELSRALKACAQ